MSCNPNDCEKNICLYIECGLVIHGLDIKIIKDDRNALLNQHSTLISLTADLYHNNNAVAYTLPIAEDGTIPYYSDLTPEVNLVINHLDTIYIMQDYTVFPPADGACCDGLKLTSFMVNGLQYCEEATCPSQVEILLD